MIRRTLSHSRRRAGATAARAGAGRPARFNQVDLQAEVSREVQNDLMNARLYVEARDPSAAKVADQLNRISAEALRIAGEFRTVRARSGYTQTYPVYDRANKLTGWRGRTEIRLESKDVQAMAALLGKLQPTMQLGGVSFTVSPSCAARPRTAHHRRVAASARADIAAKALGAGATRSAGRLNTGGFAPGPRPMAAARMAPQARSRPPVFEAGRA
jgi:predicted secreted protein